MKLIKVLMPIVGLTTLTGFVGPMTSCKDDVVVSSRANFNTCKWSVITDACNTFQQDRDLDAFCEKFQVDNLATTDPNDKMDAKALDDFVGQTRTVKIEGLHHKVIVLGCKQDFKDEQKQYPVTFTFQFTNLISNKDGTLRKVAWDNTGSRNSNYWNSSMHTFLNNEGSGATSVFNFIKNEKDNDGLANNIKPVYRKVNTDVDKDNTWDTTTGVEKIFLPVLANYFSTYGLQATAWKLGEEQTPLYIAEGTQYQYFKPRNMIGDLYMIYPDGTDVIFDFLHYRDIARTGDYVYWIGSPYLSVTTSCVWNIWGNCFKYTGHAAWEGAGIAPCFCI